VTGSRQLLVLAIDAASPSLLRSWAADGTLPNISRLMATGLVGDTCAVGPLFVGNTWPCFYTGLNPGGHGLYWFEQLRTGSYRTERLTPADVGRRKALWEILSDAGHRVLVLDVPLSRRSPELNGAQVVEWRTHDALSGLKKRILRITNERPAPATCDAPTRSLREYHDLADNLARSAAARARLTCELLSDEPWDFAIQVFKEAHCAGHQLWHFHDPAHPAFDAATTGENGDLVRQVYVAIDGAIGEILTRVEPATTVVLLTLHGMSWMSGASRILREVLIRLGVTHAPSSEPPTRPLTPRERLVERLRAAYHRVPDWIRRPLYDMRVHISRRWLGGALPPGFDPDRSKCFPVETGPLVGGIRLNLRGREPMGALSPGAESEEFCARLTRLLLEINRPETGRPLVRRVLRTADLHHGAFVDELPDLLVEWDLEPLGTTVAGTGAGAVLRAESPRIGLIEMVNGYCRTGEHRPEGMFVARGPGLTPGALGRAVSNLDLAPTLARRLGCEMPNVDGELIPELLQS
jgi:predicted AlkP superfamily phosphohydrolase/phosphomutase